ncbi:hypothetical protein D3C81_1680140 [compost metagenome]
MSTLRAQVMAASEARHDIDSTMKRLPSTSKKWYSWKPDGSRPPKVAWRCARVVGNVFRYGSLARLRCASVFDAWLPALT